MCVCTLSTLIFFSCLHNAMQWVYCTNYLYFSNVFCLEQFLCFGESPMKMMPKSKGLYKLKLSIAESEPKLCLGLMLVSSFFAHLAEDRKKYQWQENGFQQKWSKWPIWARQLLYRIFRLLSNFAQLYEKSLGMLNISPFSEKIIILNGNWDKIRDLKVLHFPL